MNWDARPITLGMPMETGLNKGYAIQGTKRSLGTCSTVLNHSAAAFPWSTACTQSSQTSEISRWKWDDIIGWTWMVCGIEMDWGNWVTIISKWNKPFWLTSHPANDRLQWPRGEVAIICSNILSAHQETHHNPQEMAARPEKISA